MATAHLKKRLAEFSEVLFSDTRPAIDLRQLASLCFRGIPDVGGLRSLCWQLLLGYLPPDRRKWPAVLKARRQSYFDLVSDFARNPRRPSKAESTERGHGQGKQHLLEQIRADINRTMPDIALFHTPIYQEEADDSRCGTNVSESTATSTESVDTTATLLAVPLKRISVSTPPSRTDATSQGGSSSFPWQVGQLQRSLSEKISAALGSPAQLGDKLPQPIHDAGCNQHKNDHEIVADASGTAAKQADAAPAAKGENGWLMDQPQTHAEALARILFVHAQFNRGVGYAQGMNEILAPIYYVLASCQPAVPGYSHDDCEADSFHMFILALRGVHLDMFISAMDSTSSSAASHEGRTCCNAGAQPLPTAKAHKLRRIHPHPGHENAALEIAQHGMLISPLMASGALGATSSCIVPAPETAGAIARLSAPTRSTSQSPDVSALTAGEIGGLQHILKYWWCNYVRLADRQLWMRMDGLGIQPEHFALRWLLVWGAREFSLPDVLLLWDALMANRARLATAHTPADSSSKDHDRLLARDIARGLQAACEGDSRIIKPGQFRSIKVDVGKLACDIRIAQGISGDDDDASQLGLLFDFFAAVLLAMKPQIMDASFEECIALLQCLPRHIKELEMFSLISSTLRIRQRRACGRAIRACRNVLAAADPRKRDSSAARIAPLFASLSPPVSPASSTRSGHRAGCPEEGGEGVRAQGQQSPVDTPAAKVSRFFGQLTGKLRLATPPVSPTDRQSLPPALFGPRSVADNPAEACAASPLSPLNASASAPDCLLLAVPRLQESQQLQLQQKARGAANGPRRLGIFEVIDYSDHTRTAVIRQLGECDALSPSLVDTGTLESAGKRDIWVRVEPTEPEAASAQGDGAAQAEDRLQKPSAAAAAPSQGNGGSAVPPQIHPLPHREPHTAKHHHSHMMLPSFSKSVSAPRPLLVSPHSLALPSLGRSATEPGRLVGAGRRKTSDGGSSSSTIVDGKEAFWWKSIPASPHARLRPLNIELCDYDSDSE